MQFHFSRERSFRGPLALPGVDSLEGIVVVVIVVGTVITAKSESVWIGEGTRGIGKIGNMRHRTSGRQRRRERKKRTWKAVNRQL
jgi:hypothetical protein